MKSKFILLVLLPVFKIAAQNDSFNSFTLTPELAIGITNASNANFPDRGLQRQVFMSFGWGHQIKQQEWASFLKTTKSGFSIGYTDLANNICSIGPQVLFNKNNKATN